MNIKAYILHAWKMAGTDVHFKVSYPVFYRDRHGELEVISKEKLTYAELHGRKFSRKYFRRIG